MFALCILYTDDSVNVSGIAAQGGLRLSEWLIGRQYVTAVYVVIVSVHTPVGLVIYQSI